MKSNTTVLALGVSIGCAALLTACGSDNNDQADKLASAPNAALACSELVGAQIPASFTPLSTNGATIDRAVLVAADDPANRSGEYCQVHGPIKPVDKTASDIKVQINLPSQWNGKSLHYGGGGFHGVLQTALNHPEGSLLYGEDFLGRGEVSPAFKNGPPTPLRQGYVTFGSDSGHQASSIWEGSFALNEEALKNFSVDQLKKTKDLALHLTQRRYGEQPKQVYFAGGSEGGREALKLVQEYPREYHGVIAVYPVLNWIPKALHDNRMVRELYAASGANWISPEQNTRINTAVRDACDDLDGAKDGVVSNIVACAGKEAEILQSLRCAAGGGTGGCLSEGQIGVVRAFNTPRQFDYPLANGFNTMPGYSQLVGADIGILFGTRPVPAIPPTEANDALMGVWSDQVIRFMIAKDTHLNSLEFDEQAFLPNILKVSEMLDATKTDISEFKNAGGKLIIVHGTEDQMVTPYGTIDYFNALKARFGEQALGDFVKFYLVPGFSHGSGTFYARIETLAALDDWVVQKKAPQALIAEDQNPANSKRTRPACLWPAYPHYDNQGDVNAATSFTCRLP
ncbi:MAG: tannase/feruloyl esterase family alpha/beta hydrolase [Noviherbaspirillum sp.]